VAREFDRATLLSSLEELVKSIAHDVNQPLGAVLMTARACRRGIATQSLSPELVSEGLDRIVVDVQRASEILAQFRAATRRPSAMRASTDLNAVIRRALADAGPELAAGGVAPAIDLAPVLPSVHADHGQLHHVVRTLIAHALHAMSAAAEGDRSLTLRSTLTTSREVAVDVEHGGPGMLASEAERVFEPFMTTRQGTTGLELAVCRAIVEEHDGRIWTVASVQGTLFRFTLPAADGQ
jgi:signal transduction histidine kinase